jgi:hypothetical protein
MPFTEMVFLNGISGRGFLDINSGFFWFSTLIFLFYKMIFVNILEFSCFADFLFVFFKPKKSVVFFKIRPVAGIVNSMEQKTRVFC